MCVKLSSAQSCCESKAALKNEVESKGTNFQLGKYWGCNVQTIIVNTAV